MREQLRKHSTLADTGGKGGGGGESFVTQFAKNTMHAQQQPRTAYGGERGTGTHPTYHGRARANFCGDRERGSCGHGSGLKTCVD